MSEEHDFKHVAVWEGVYRGREFRLIQTAPFNPPEEMHQPILEVKTFDLLGEPCWNRYNESVEVTHAVRLLAFYETFHQLRMTLLENDRIERGKRTLIEDKRTLIEENGQLGIKLRNVINELHDIKEVLKKEMEMRSATLNELIAIKQRPKPVAVLHKVKRKEKK